MKREISYAYYAANLQAKAEEAIQRRNTWADMFTTIAIKREQIFQNQR